MKKLVFLLVALIFVSYSTNAQYKINKTHYDYHSYSYQVGDPYNTGVAGLCSFLIPGLGQMLSGETGRGFAFLGADLGFSALYIVGVVNSANDISMNGDGSSGAGLMVAGGIGMLVVDIWAIVDAVRVAKVNNLAFRDKNKTSFNLKIQPIIFQTNNSKTASGLSIKVTF